MGGREGRREAGIDGWMDGSGRDVEGELCGCAGRAGGMGRDGAALAELSSEGGRDGGHLELDSLSPALLFLYGESFLSLMQSVERREAELIMLPQ